MTQLSLDHATETGTTLVCRLTPSGRIDVHPGSPGEGPGLSTAVQRRILHAFDAGRGHGVLQLGAGELSTELHPTLSYWRDIGKTLVARVCGALDPTDPKSLVVPEPTPEELADFAQAAPPMQGAELITAAMLGELWSDMGRVLTSEAAHFQEGVQGYLNKQSSVWNVVGRVCFHLAENKRDPSLPFAFIATYVHKVSEQAKPQHLPLGRALEDYAGAKNRQKLLALLSPLSRAAEQSAFIRELVDCGDIYHPLSWTPTEAHRFLSEIALYEQAGLVVRMPDWWSAKSPPRPKVSVSVGGKAPSTLGMDALLDFDVKLTLDGKNLSAKEIERLLAASEGLVLIKGKWVEVDRDKLGAVLDQWREVQEQARAGGISFGEAMRMLAGAQLDSGDADGSEDIRPEWSQVIAGKWLSSRLDALRSPALQAEIDAGAGLRTALRPYQKRGVQWLWTLRGLELGGCLADDMGLGKTIQVLGVLSMSRRKKENGTDLLVVPATLIDNWRLEMERFAPDLKVLIAHPLAHPLARAKEAAKERSGQPRCGDHHLRHRHAHRVDTVPCLAQRGPRRGPGHQEPRRQADQGGQSVGRQVAPGPHRHAGGELPGRSVVDLRLPEPGAAGLGEGLQQPVQIHGVGQASRLRAPAQAVATVYLAQAQDRQNRHRRSARQDRGQCLVPAQQAPGRPVPAVGGGDEAGPSRSWKASSGAVWCWPF